MGGGRGRSPDFGETDLTRGTDMKKLVALLGCGLTALAIGCSESSPPTTSPVMDPKNMPTMPALPGVADPSGEEKKEEEAKPEEKKEEAKPEEKKEEAKSDEKKE